MSHSKSANDSTQNLSHPDFLGGLSAQEFLNKYWQQQPLLLKNAFPDQINCLCAEELAGFSLEEHIESRIIIEHENNQWQLLTGPFEEDTFEKLPAQKWTLLIQAIDHYVAEFAALLDQFNFIPQWRIDDLMMSYATTGGSVGPHYDYYDVFLIQVSGQRHWQIGQLCDDTTELIADLPMRIVKEFEQHQDHILIPGDVLYLPPGVAHHGTALDDDCITLSVGFRAPSYSEIISDYGHYLAARLSGNQRFIDGKLIARNESHNHSGLITDNDIDNLHSQITKTLADKEALKEWFALYLSESKYSDPELMESDLGIETFQDLLANNECFQRDESSRFVLTQTDNKWTLWINGTAETIPQEIGALGNYICSRRVLEGDTLATLANTDPKIQWLYDLLCKGFIYRVENQHE